VRGGERGGGGPRRPSRALRRRPWTEAPFVALDFETTGLDARADSVISWGVVPVESGGIDLRGADYRLVAPAHPPGPETVRIHQLRPVDLADAPALPEIRHLLRGALDGRFLLAWAAGVEIGFLRRIFGGSSRAWRRRTVDVRELAVERLRSEDDSARSTTLEGACRRLGVPVERTHHAFDDALMTAELLLVLATGRAQGTSRPPTVRDLVRAS
jgi:DNA polymerase-3 subunit epsilon